MPTTTEASQPDETPHRSRRAGVSRRMFLKRAGIGAGAVIVVVGAATMWRAADQGVFATDEGAAYGAWGEWDTRTGGTLLPLVRSAILAANAHNTQPWLFALGTNRIDLFADQPRNMGTMDPLRREMYLSLGCALENLTLAARANGLDPTVTLLPMAGEAAHVARVDFTPMAAVASPLYAAIPHRHTNRGVYDRARPIDASIFRTMTGLNTHPDLALVWLTTATEMGHFADLTLQATAAIIADPEQARDDFAWWRRDWHALQTHKDGITLDPSGLPDFTRAVGKILPAQSLAAYGAAWAAGVRDRQVSTAAAFGLLATRNRTDNAQRIAAGQLWQRLHLYATAQGLAMQPLCQTLERIDREQATEGDPVITRAFATELPESSSGAVMAFRIGYPTVAPHLSPRRPAQEVLRP